MTTVRQMHGVAAQERGVTRLIGTDQSDFHAIPENQNSGGVQELLQKVSGQLLVSQIRVSFCLRERDLKLSI